jgi:hypothetical protein
VNPLIKLFEAFVFAFAVVAFVVCVRQSARDRRVRPALWLLLGLLGLSWLEAPYDWATYASFHPDFIRLPQRGVFVTHGRLPAMALPAYAFYFMLPSLGAVAAARYLSARRGWNRVWTLLGVGFAVGFVWDLCFETFGTWTGLWKYTRAAPGLVLFPGSTHQFPVYISLAIGFQVMACAYLLGRLNDRGETFIAAAVRRRMPSGRGTAIVTFAGVFAYLNGVYLAGYLPSLATKRAGLQTVEVPTRVYAEFPNQAR